LGGNEASKRQRKAKDKEAKSTAMPWKQVFILRESARPQNSRRASTFPFHYKNGVSSSRKLRGAEEYSGLKAPALYKTQNGGPERCEKRRGIPHR
jgi:hypothetical protein